MITPIKEYGEIKYIIVDTQEVTDRVFSHIRLEEKNKQLKLILDSISDNITIINKDGRYIEVTDSINEKFKNDGRTYKEVYSEIEVYDCDGNVIPLEETVVAKVLRGDKVKNYKTLAIIKGKKVYLNHNGVSIFNDDGELELGIIISYDITESIEKEEQIKEQKKLLEAVVENMADGLSIFNSKGEYILFNKAAKDMISPSYKNLDKVGDGYYQAKYYDEEDNIIPNDSIPAQKVIRGESFIGMRMKAVFPDKVLHISVSGTSLYDDKGNFYMGILCSRDITDSVNKEQIIKEKKEQLEIIMENMDSAFFIFDKNGKYVFVNKAARERVGRSLNKVGQTYEFIAYYDIYGNKVPYEDTPNYHALNGKSVSDMVILMKTPDKESYMSVSGSPIFDDKGNLIYGIVTSHDVTDLINYQKAIKLQEQQLLKAEIDKRYSLEKSIEMKDDFLSLISHEFRTPLNVINSAIQAINYFCVDNLDERAKKYFKMVQQNTYRLLRLVNNLLDITRADAGRIKIKKKNLDIVFLTRSIVDSVDTYAMHKRIKLIFKSSFNEKVIAIDDEKYERILLNILANAVKFTPEGGEINVKMQSKNGFIYIEVKDSGIGIPKDKLGTIFERFEQVDSSFARQSEGTGIGLSLVKRFVEALGGSITVKSKENKGSTFTILIPKELVSEEVDEATGTDLLNNRLVDVTNVEFSDIYF
nr:PAS domain-containing sensor histidine kinase [Clostridium yunnanense]